MQNDYIMRMIEHVVRAIVAIVQKRQEGNYKEATQSITTACSYYLKIDIDILLLTHTSDQILDHFKGLTGPLDAEKYVLFADLLYELSLIREAQKEKKDSIRLKKLCLCLYSIGIPIEPNFQSSQYFKKVEDLIKELKDQEFSEKSLAYLDEYKKFIATQI